MNAKNTKRALVSSALVVLVCIAMLIGTTFAWFTDTASTSVNKIVSGKLMFCLNMPFLGCRRKSHRMERRKGPEP